MRRLLKWINDHLMGRDRAVRARVLSDLVEGRRKWDSLSEEERAAKTAQFRAEQAQRDTEAEARAIQTFPFERVTVPGDQALAVYDRLKREGRGSPVILGGPGALAMIEEMREHNAGRNAPQEALARASTLTHPQGLRDAKAAELARLRKAHPDVFESMEEEGEGEREDWPDEDVAPMNGPTVTFDLLARKPLERCHVALIPTRDWTEIPAYLGYGGWNDCPAPEYHVAAMRAWRDRYGAELVCASQDVLEFRVARPPATREEALALAREQYEFCADIVDQGVGSVGALAAGLLNASWWYFWWD